MPNLDLLYRHQSRAIFCGFHIVAGGGSVDWKDGDVTTVNYVDMVAFFKKSTGTENYIINNQSIKSKSCYMDYMAGAGYKISNAISVGLAGSIITAKRSARTNLNFNLDGDTNPADTETAVDIRSAYNYDAAGYRLMPGIDIRPVNGLTMGLRYETETKLNFKYSMKERTASINGASDPVLTGVLATVDKDEKKVRYDLQSVVATGS